MDKVEQASMPMAINIKMNTCLECEPVNEKLQRGLMGSLHYQTAGWAHIIFIICLCPMFKSCPEESHLKVVKTIFKYLVRTLHWGLCNPTDVEFKFVGTQIHIMQDIELIKSVQLENANSLNNH